MFNPYIQWLLMGEGTAESIVLAGYVEMRMDVNPIYLERQLRRRDSGMTNA